MEWKIIAILILGILLLIFSMLFIGGFFGEAGKIFDKNFDQFEKGFVQSQCAVGTVGGSCREILDEAACRDYGSGPDPSQKECAWCYGSVSGGIVGSCEAKVCGCGILRTVAVLKLDDLTEETFKPGQSMRVTGKVLRSPYELGGLEVQLSFLNSGKAPTKEIGSSGKVLTKEDGSFEWEHEVPVGADEGRYFVIASFSDSGDLKTFWVEK